MDADRAAEEGGVLRTIRLDLTFDGTDFRGWQRQAGEGRTVQGEVEGALERLLGSPHAVVASGRTDAGVHAARQVLSFRTAHPMDPADIARALDALLPEDVGVLAAALVPDGFHARKAALWKWYRYTILRTRSRRPLLRRTTWRFAGRLDLDVLHRSAAVLRGRNDFASFGNAGSPRGSTVRTIHSLAATEEGELLHLDVVGDGFLYKMVRTIVGTLVDVSRPGGFGPEGVDAVLRARDRRRAGPAAPAHGLTLMAVAVRGEPVPEGVPPSLRPRSEAAVESALQDPTARGPRGDPS